MKTEALIFVDSLWTTVCFFSGWLAAVSYRKGVFCRGFFLWLFWVVLPAVLALIALVRLVWGVLK